MEDIGAALRESRVYLYYGIRCFHLSISSQVPLYMIKNCKWVHIGMNADLPSPNISITLVRAELSNSYDNTLFVNIYSKH